MKYQLGRRYAPDERDKLYLIPPRRLSDSPVYRYWHAGAVLDQGMTPQCVGYAGNKFLVAGPIRNKSPHSPYDLYKASQQNDEWPGDDYDGTSVRGLFKSLKNFGYVSRYVWTWNIDVMMAHVLSVGPVVVGTSWFESMFYPSDDGIIRPSGENVGGHAYLVIGGNRKTGYCRILNSWGSEWGQNGRAWISFEDMQLLLNDYGECCTATEVVK